MVESNTFREDLYYRLHVIEVRVPPLRERIEDVPAISAQVLERIARDAGLAAPLRLTRAAWQHLTRYAFPGNVRELENLLHRAVALSAGEMLDVADLGLPETLLGDATDEAPVADEALPEALAVPPPATATARGEAELPSDLAAYLDEVERDVLVRALARHRFNRTAAGASLGLSLRQMRYRMARLGINVAEQAFGLESERHGGAA
jgi:two-component system response regulator PilR (NtrC family)